MLFVDVIIPLSVPNLFTYAVDLSKSHEVEVGKRVVVPFGGNRLYTAIIRKIHQVEPQEYKAKQVEFVLDEAPIIKENQLRFWEWIAEYYMAPIGDVMQMALPSGFKLVSETKILLNSEHPDMDALDDKEYLVTEALLIQPILTIQEISSILGIKSVHAIIKSLLEKGIVLVEEEVQEKYTAKKEKYIRMGENCLTQNALQKALEELSRAPKQEDCLLSITVQKGFDFESFQIKKSTLTNDWGFGTNIINALKEKQFLEEFEVEVGRFEEFEGEILGIPELSDDQQKAFFEIHEGFSLEKPVLLHGVTGSGKTEIYFHIIKELVSAGKQVLYLLPEIALTTQLVKRLQTVFGEAVGVYHSKFNLNEKVEIWNDVLSNEGRFKVVVGARSSLFLPFSNLGGIIVDEEHESTFKQYDPAPRYHARDAAIYYSAVQKIPMLLGTATPSVESYYNARSNKFHLVELKCRFGGIQMPEILVADVQQERKQKTMRGLFSKLFLDHAKLAFERGQQIILFQNRRGYAPVLECDVCGHVEKCDRCDVSLTYHKTSNILRCHYCGFIREISISCAKCGSVETGFKGSGTEQIEEEFQKLFPKVKIQRMDLDTTRRKNAYEEIIQDFASGQIDVLVGTQMITKGLDFDNVALVGILNADQMLAFPDFRSHERAYQLMTQVAGRAGRRGSRGKVIIQSYNPWHSIIRNVVDYDYHSMYSSEILTRRNFYYPPFFRLIELTFKDKNKDLVEVVADGVTNGIRSELGNKRVLGPEFPVVSRINNLYHKNTLIKIDRDLSVQQAKLIIQKWIDKFKSDKAYRRVRVVADVDPN
jgi:primosomal protein N' (replication factor Y)